MTQLSAASSLRLGTRGSLLARAQSQLVANELERLHPDLRVELVIIRTSGDAITRLPLHEIGGKGLFTKELELALLADSIDFAVHSYKDVPVTMPMVEQTDLTIAAVPRREDPRDLLVSSKASSITELPPGALVATGSLRRRCQILSHRPDIRIESVRGNIDTRLGKLKNGHFDALILAAAGVHRAGLFDPTIMTPIDAVEMLPASGQGALALQCRREDIRTRAALEAMNDSTTQRCVSAERELVGLLKGDCHSPIAAFAESTPEGWRFRAVVGAAGGTGPVLRAEAIGGAAELPALPRRAFEQLLADGVMGLLHPQ